MKQNDYKDFHPLWVSACEAATGKRPSDGAVDFIFDSLMDLELQEIFHALQSHANHPDTCDYWPKPGSIRRAIHGGGDLVSQQAWKKVYHALRCIGRTDDIRFEDPLIMQTIEDLGGWQLLIDTDDDSIAYKENDFKKTYRGYTNTGLMYPAPEVFRGIENIQRINMGEEPKRFPSYEQKLERSKTQTRDNLPTLPRPIDKLIEEGARESATTGDILAGMKALLGMVTESKND